MPKLYQSIVSGTLLLLASGAAGASLFHHRASTSTKHKAAKHARTTRAGTAATHPRVIDDDRAVQIQNALVKAGYLQDVSGHWDSTSQAAMQKMQADNGWQTKMIPDSRALIKLGLGPESKPQQPSTTAPGGSQQLPGL